MAVTKILFKQGASVPGGTSAFATQGEPLWRTGANELYVTNGTQNPTLIGPYNHNTDHAKGAIIVSSSTPNITGSTAVTGVTNGYLTGTADSGYAINGLTIDETGHVVALSAVALPTAGSSVTVTPIESTGTKIATITVNGTDYDIYAPTSGGSSGGRDDELTAAAGTTTGSAVLKTSAGYRKVTLLHEAQSNGSGTYATFTVANDGGEGDKTVTMAITEINGGTW
jgi:hypothetical protein